MEEFYQPVGFEIVDLSDDLERILNHKVDVVSSKALRPRLKTIVEEELVYV